MIISAVPFAALDPLTAYGLWKLRQDVFVIEQECLFRDLDGQDLLPDTRHVVLEDEQGVVLGCARVAEDSSDGHGVWRIGRVAGRRSRPSRSRKRHSCSMTNTSWRSFQRP